jgi:hypothetical protein
LASSAFVAMSLVMPSASAGPSTAPVAPIASSGPVTPPIAPIPSASPSSDAAVEPLKEIGHVKATTTFCQTIIDHAVKAVTLGVDNDKRISVVVQTMRASDFDTNDATKQRGLQQLAIQYSPFTEQAIAAEKAAKALRVDAQKAPTPEQAASLTAFADALDGALHRQRTIARDLASMMALFNARPAVTKMQRDEMVMNVQLGDSYRGPMSWRPVEEQYYPETLGGGIDWRTPDERVYPLLSDLADQGADDFVVREEGVKHDEATAAQLVGPAFAGC